MSIYTNLPDFSLRIAYCGSAIGGAMACASSGLLTVKNARYYTGPKGLSTYYTLFRADLAHTIRWTAFYVAALYLADLFYSPRGQAVESASLASTVTTFGAVTFAAVGSFYLGHALAFMARWMALEYHGPVYALNNGKSYRVHLIRPDGTHIFNLITWLERQQLEEKGLFDNRAELASNLKRLLVAAGAVGATWYGCSLLMTAGLPALSYVITSCRLDVVLPVLVAVIWATSPLSQFLLNLTDRVSYHAGAQFSALTHVKEAFEKELEIADAEKQVVYGDGKFQEPFKK